MANPYNEARIIDRIADFIIDVFDRKNLIKIIAVIPYSTKWIAVSDKCLVCMPLTGMMENRRIMKSHRMFKNNHSPSRLFLYSSLLFSL